MKCPVDNETLVMTDRNGVEIDYCPSCRGVWLDRGELDKIIDRAGAASAPEPARRQDYRQEQRDDRGHDRGHDRGQGPSQYGHKPYRKKKESFLSELFDF